MVDVCLLFLSVIISAIIVDRFNIGGKSLTFLLTFSGAYLLTIAFTHIIPDIFSSENKNYLGYFILLGFFIQLIVEYFSGGIEHGHNFSHDHHHEAEQTTPHKIVPYALFIGLGVHSFFEGMPFASEFHQQVDNHQHSLLIGIIIHKVPIAIVLMGLFLSSGMPKIKAYLMISIFALITPLGSIFGGLIGESLGVNIDFYYQIVMALLVGIFLHVSTTIIFESNTSHRFNLIKFIVIFVAVFIAILSNNI